MGAFGLAIIIGLLFGIAVVNEWSEADGLIASLALLLVVAWVWSRLSLQRLGLTRELSRDRVRAGEDVTEILTLQNHSRLPKLWVEIRDYSTLPSHTVSRAMHVGGSRSLQWSVSTLCERRGRYRLGPIVASSGDPLGLFNQQRQIPSVHELMVLPALVDVSQIPLPAEHLSGGETVPRTTSAASPTIAGLREYVPGDPLNHISWAATARRGTVMVKEFEPDPTSDIQLLLDLNDTSLRPLARPLSSGAVLDSTEDVAVSVAASLAESALETNRKVGLVIHRGDPMRIVQDESYRQWTAIMESLAVAHTLGHRDLAETIAVEAQRIGRMTAMVIVTATRETAWVASLPLLLERMIPVTVVLIDDTYDAESRTRLARLERAIGSMHATVIRYPVHHLVTASGTGLQRRTHI